MTTRVYLIGHEVVCISNDGFYFHPFPQVGDICRVEDVKFAFGKRWLRLQRYNYSTGIGPGKVVAFCATNFVPLDLIGRDTQERILLMAKIEIKNNDIHALWKIKLTK
jgi:hypothetical protein